jgi:GDP-L-fucose synthase
MAKVLVTGGHGFLGKRLINALKLDGHDVVAPSIDDVDLRVKNQVCNMFHEHGPEIVIHAAARVGGISENKAAPAEFFYDNAMMGMNVIEEAMRHNVRKFVQIGTACSYPASIPLPYRERHIWDGYPEVSNAPYGLAKRMLLEQLRAYREQYGFNGIYLIPTNLYGTGDKSHHVIPDAIRKISDAKKNGSSYVTFWGTGSVTRDFLHVDDAVSGIVYFTKYYNDGTPVNLATGQEHCLRDVIELIAKLMKYEGKIRFTGDTEMNGQIRRVLYTNRANILGWKARVPFQVGLQNMIDLFEA